MAYKFPHRQKNSDPQWALKMIQVLDKKGKRIVNKKGDGIRIGHPDSGLIEHNEFSESNIDKKNIRDFTNQDISKVKVAIHGTSTASVLVGKTVGVAPNATLVPIKVIKQRKIFTPIMLQTDLDRLNLGLEHAIEAKCDVISMSIGTKEEIFYHEHVAQTLKRAVESGMIVIAAAGNTVKTVAYPANDSNVIATSACNDLGKEWNGTARAPMVSISGPGEDIHRAYAIFNEEDDELKQSSGSSYAATHLAGSAALWLEKNKKYLIKKKYPKKHWAKIFKYELMTKGFSENEHLDPDQFGVGVLNVKKILEGQLMSKTKYDQLKETFELEFEGRPLGVIRSVFYHKYAINKIDTKLSELFQYDSLEKVIIKAGLELMHIFSADDYVTDEFRSYLDSSIDTDQARSVMFDTVSDMLRIGNNHFRRPALKFLKRNLRDD